MRYIIRIIAAIVIAMASLAASGQDIVRKSERIQPLDSVDLIIVKGDTVPRILPQRNFGRFDRGLANYTFIPKGKWGFGLNASYGEINTDDIQILDIIKNFDFKGKMYSIKPYVTYFIASNQSVGLKFNYTRGIADLDNLGVDFDDDINFDLHNVSYYQQSFMVSTFYRNYIGLDRAGRFGIFNEVELGFGSGSSRFKRYYNDVLRDTRTNVTQGALNFSPGLCVFIQEHVSFNVSFGVFGLKWRKEDQTTNGIDEGSRVTSGANFRFNIFNINFGLMVVI